MNVIEMSYTNLWAFADKNESESVTVSEISGFDSMMKGVINLILRIIDSVELAVNETYQMGIGIVSERKPLLDLCNSYS